MTPAGTTLGPPSPPAEPEELAPVELTPATVGALLVAALLLGLAGLVCGLVAIAGQRKVQQAYRGFTMDSRDDVVTILGRHLDEVERLRGDAAEAHRRIDEVRELLRGAVSRVATVRYDAFDDMGGRLSFSTALLDERGDGVVITAINGRVETRTYAKRVSATTSRRNLSQEEVAAIEQAMSPAGSAGAEQRRVLDARTSSPETALEAQAHHDAEASAS
jgi:hypothetical protein